MNESMENCTNRPDKAKDECLCKVIDCICKNGATGPTGPTERLFKSSNKIIIDSS